MESGLVAPGSLLSCASFLSSSRNRESVRASQTCTLAVFGPQELDILLVRSPTYSCNVLVGYGHCDKGCSRWH